MPLHFTLNVFLFPGLLDHPVPATGRAPDDRASHQSVRDQHAPLKIPQRAWDGGCRSRHRLCNGMNKG